MTNEIPEMPSPSGVRAAGDRYQWLYTWGLCVDLLIDAENHGEPNPGVAVGIEENGLVPLDDAVYYRRQPPHTYAQLKWAVDATTPVNAEYMSNKKLLERLVQSWQKLTADGAPIEVVVVSTRNVDPTDPLAAAQDSRTQQLVPRGAARTPKALVDSRAQWARIANCSEDTLLQFLASTRFRTGLDHVSLRELVRHKMMASGLTFDDAAIDAGTSWIQTTVIDGHRRISLDTVKAFAATMKRTPAWTRVSISTLSPDPDRCDVAASVDWVERIEGDSPFQKVAPGAPWTWEQLAADIEGLRAVVDTRKRVFVTGTMRQATGFYAGAVFRRVVGYSVACQQNGDLWTSEDTGAPYKPAIEDRVIGAGDDVAILTAIAFDAADAVEQYLKDTHRPVGHLFVVRPSSGVPDDRAISSAEEANALAVAVRDLARLTSGPGKTHLFQAGPLALAVLLGHRWNRIAPTSVYEHLHGARYPYLPAFSVDA